jgi:hypothetical protein
VNLTTQLAEVKYEWRYAWNSPIYLREVHERKFNFFLSRWINRQYLKQIYILTVFRLSI